MFDVNKGKWSHNFHGYLFPSGLLDVLQLLEDALGGKLQNPPTLTHSLETIIIFPGALDFTSLGCLSRNLWGNCCSIFAFKSFRILV